MKINELFRIFNNRNIIEHIILIFFLQTNVYARVNIGFYLRQYKIKNTFTALKYITTITIKM